MHRLFINIVSIFYCHLGEAFVSTKGSMEVRLMFADVWVSSLSSGFVLDVGIIVRNFERITEELLLLFCVIADECVRTQRDSRGMRLIFSGNGRGPKQMY